MFKLKSPLYAVVFSTLISSLTFGATANLDDLLLGDSLNLGSVTITNFAEIPTGIASSGLAFPVDPSLVMVEATLNGDRLDVDFLPFLANASGGGTVDYSFLFDIITNSGISRAQLIQIAGGPDASFVTIDETITYSGGSATLQTSDMSTAAETTLTGTPSTIRVQKDVHVESVGSGSAQISGLRQRYVLVPESGTMGLAMIGLLGIIGLARRRRS